MGGINIMSKIKSVKLSEDDKTIDNIVKSEALDNSKWDKVLHVSHRSNATSIRLSPNTIQRAKFFARIHRERGYQTWLKKIIEERIDTENKLYQEIKSKAA